MEKLYIWNWVGGGYNSCKATSREEALQKAQAMGKRCNLEVDEATLGVGTYKQLERLDRSYS